MLRAKLGLCLAIGCGVQFGYGQTQFTIRDLLREVRTLEANTKIIRLSFSGDRALTSPMQVPSLKSSESQFTPSRKIDTFAGDFLKYGRSYFIRYRRNSDPKSKIAQSDGYKVADYEESGNSKQSGVNGTLYSADYKCAVPIFEHFGTFFMHRHDWIQSKSLSDLVEQTSVEKVEKTREGNWLFTLKGLDKPFFVTVDPRQSGKILRFGFLIAKQGVQAEVFWTESDYKTIDGKQIPTKLEYVNRYSDHGNIITEDRYHWDVQNVSFGVRQEDVLKPLPEGFVFGTFDGQHAGRVVNENGDVHPVEADYGSSEYKKRSLIQKAILGAAALIVLIIATFVGRTVRKRYRR